MAVTDLNSNEWINNDQLKVLFANDGARSNRGGEYSQLDSGLHCVEINIDMRSLNATDDLIIADNVTIPSGALLEEVETLATEAAVGGTSLSVGLVRYDFTTVTAAGGILSAAPIADHNADGDKTTYRVGVTGAGTAFGTVTTNPHYISARSVGTYTDGVVRVRIYYTIPLAADLN